MKKFWLPALLFAAVLALVLNCGETTTGPGEAAGYFLGAEACRQCHSTAYKDAIKTAHFNTFVDDPENPYDFVSIWKADGRPEYCLQCHTTGWDPGKGNHGADEVEYRKGLLGVQCEACHGPGSEHVKGGGDAAKITLSYDAGVCGACHTGDHNPTYGEWEESEHADALNGLKSSSHPQDNCLECHSADYWYDRTVTLASAQYGITCATCHFAHGSNFEHQLREEGERLCSLCHTDEGARPPSAPHHTQDEMLAGIGGYEWPQGGPYLNSDHTYVVEERCKKCHMYAKPFEEGKPAIKGHTWKPRIEPCRECHPGANSFNIGGAQRRIERLLEELEAKLERQRNKQAQDYIYAKFDYDFVENDGSYGVHNYKYARQLLEDSIEFYEPSGDDERPYGVARGR
ncbi:MAG TPA: multiheme c-type cytochrome [bacterium]|nr:multiheme c-type cytochrome [bacterium]